MKEDRRQVAVSVNDLHKSFKLPYEQHSGIKQLIINRFNSNKGYKTQNVLKNISFEIKKGEFFGIVGRNGSGKSTLLKLLANIYRPDKGTIAINGKLTPFIELGVGFNPELTGRENIYMNGAMLGFDHSEVDVMYDDIVKFAELESFMDQKLKNYSSGMQVRLAFSIAIRADTDILLIDEVLAVGDALFQQKCFDTFKEIKKAGKTVIFISHDLGSVEAFCDRVAVISEGEMVGIGDTSEMIMKYKSLLVKYEEENEIKEDKVHTLRTGDAVIKKAEVLDSRGRPSLTIKEDEDFSIRVHFEARYTLEHPVIGLGIMNMEGSSIYGPNTLETNFDVGIIKGSYYVDVQCKGTNIATGTYTIRAAIFDDHGVIPYDFVEKLYKFSVEGKTRHGSIYVEPNWNVVKIK